MNPEIIRKQTYFQTKFGRKKNDQKLFRQELVTQNKRNTGNTYLFNVLNFVKNRTDVLLI